MGDVHIEPGKMNGLWMVLFCLSVITVHVRGQLSECGRECPEEYIPVCGSDRRTYGNDCELDIAICLLNLQGQQLKKLGDGECSQFTTVPTTTTTPELTTTSGKPTISTTTTTPKPTTTTTTTPKPTTTTTTTPKPTTTTTTTPKPTTTTTTPKPTTTTTTPKPATTPYIRCPKVQCAPGAQSVCANNGKKYACKALLDYENCMTHSRATVWNCRCWETKCGPFNRPVCGNDGKTYDCRQQLEYFNCRYGSRVYYTRLGACPTTKPGPTTPKSVSNQLSEVEKACLDIKNGNCRTTSYVCVAPDWKTYNECEYLRAKCHNGDGTPIWWHGGRCIVNVDINNLFG
ncbi:integumentary mucin C.1 [Lingula anatina]|uniref:Integumentary mucin C.1 n=1 Tax=Lingula anatina TaxID=7574 RepID=A0A1S3KAV7_LINAN|nr:integumentary mucin C.1 [Lingula anatina]|eukprot:XP_013419391.1 integumentary mucin C.1 [Lingula anatina]